MADRHPLAELVKEMRFRLKGLDLEVDRFKRTLAEGEKYMCPTCEGWGFTVRASSKGPYSNPYDCDACGGTGIKKENNGEG
jgi:predicted RNA-binding Zn-ribbon protein involved in translation (DUF1610 family)